MPINKNTQEKRGGSPPGGTYKSYHVTSAMLLKQMDVCLFQVAWHALSILMLLSINYRGCLVRLFDYDASSTVSQPLF